MNPTEVKILNVLKEEGPLLPVEIGNEVELDALLTSAVLAGMVNNKVVRRTHKKIGNSPLYYTPEHAEQARQMLMSRLSHAERELLDKFERQHAFYLDQLSPQERFFLREIMDFVQPGQDGDRIFWRIHTVSEGDARKILSGAKHEPEEPKKEKKPEPVKELKAKNEREIDDIFDTPRPRKPRASSPGSKFEEKVLNFFESRDIAVQRKEIIKKTSEINLFAYIPTKVGHQAYFIKARKKARFTNRDISVVWSEGSKYRMPILVLIDGSIMKSARDELKNGELSHLITLRELE